MKILYAFRYVLPLAILLTGFNNQITAQDDEPNLYTGISSVILPKDGKEINLLNSLSSFWMAINAYDAQIDATRIVDRVRYSRADHVLRLTYGFSSNNRWDLGGSLHYTRVRIDDAARSSPFRVYGNANPETGETFSGISGFGLQVRAVPFAGLKELTARAGVVFPVAKSDDLKTFLNAQRTQVFLAATFYQRLGASTMAFLQGDWRTYLRNEENNRSLMTPALSGFLVFELPNDRWFVFPGMSYGLTFQQFDKGSPYRKSSQQLYGSLGVLYRPVRAFNVLLSGQIPFILDSGSSRSIWVRESYTGINLGFRIIL